MPHNQGVAGSCPAGTTKSTCEVSQVLFSIISVQQIEKIVGSDIGIPAEDFEIVLAGRIEADGDAIEIFAELPGYIIETMDLFIWP